MVNDGTGAGEPPRHEVTPVSADDVVRVVSQALSTRRGRLRLTSGQRLAILRAPRRPGAARA